MSFDVVVVFISLNIAHIAVCNDPFCNAINHQNKLLSLLINTMAPAVGIEPTTN